MGRFPDAAAQGIGDSIFLTLEVLALVSVCCVVGAVVCLILSRYARRQARMLRWLAAWLAVAALAPPLFVVVSVNH